MIHNDQHANLHSRIRIFAAECLHTIASLVSIPKARYFNSRRGRFVYNLFVAKKSTFLRDETQMIINQALF